MLAEKNNKINILGSWIDSLNLEQVLQKINGFLNDHKQHQIITANPEIILKAAENSKYQKIINQADMVTADGVGLLWAAKYQKAKIYKNILLNLFQLKFSLIKTIFNKKYSRTVIPERITGVDLLEQICRLAKEFNWSVYFLGGRAGVASIAAKKLNHKYPELKITGAEAGPNIQISNNEIEKTEEIEYSLKKINQAGPDILFVAFGSPKQDFFIHRYLNKMASVKLAMGVGGSFDFISGQAKRAPLIYQDLGLEWLYRFFHEPWRAGRMFNATIKFIWIVFKMKNL